MFVVSVLCLFMIFLFLQQKSCHSFAVCASNPGHHIQRLRSLFQLQSRFSSSARRSASRDAIHPRVNEGEVPEHGLVHAVDERPVGTRQPGLLVDELLVEVTAVAGRRLRR